MCNAMGRVVEFPEVGEGCVRGAGEPKRRQCDGDGKAIGHYATHEPGL